VTRGWVCSLQLLLALASAVILRSETRGTHDHILLSQVRDSPNLEGQVAQLYPQALGSLLVPPTTRRATVWLTIPRSLLWALEATGSVVDGIWSGSCLMVDFGSSVLKPSGSATMFDT
jgi:hypothetical protein